MTETQYRALRRVAKRIVECVEFDVNGFQGKGGNGGLTSDDTLRAAGEIRVLLSKTAEVTEP